jgi:hypothetical protein
MKAEHSKLDGYSATLPATRPSPRRRGTSSTAACFASMRSYLRPSTHRQTSANTRSAGLRRIGRLIDPPQPDLSHHLRLVKGRMVPYHAPAPFHALST